MTNEKTHLETNSAPQPHDNDGVMKKVAVKVGAAIGTVAARAWLSRDTQAERRRIIHGKFQKNEKHRLPRKLKKAQHREAQSAPA
jgi:hypothetical protein